MSAGTPSCPQTKKHMFTVMHENMAKGDFLVQDKMAIIILVIFPLGVKSTDLPLPWAEDTCRI